MLNSTEQHCKQDYAILPIRLYIDLFSFVFLDKQSLTTATIQYSIIGLLPSGTTYVVNGTGRYHGMEHTKCLNSG